MCFLSVAECRTYFVFFVLGFSIFSWVGISYPGYHFTAIFTLTLCNCTCTLYCEGFANTLMEDVVIIVFKRSDEGMILFLRSNSFDSWLSCKLCLYVYSVGYLAFMYRNIGIYVFHTTPWELEKVQYFHFSSPIKDELETLSGD